MPSGRYLYSHVHSENLSVRRITRRSRLHYLWAMCCNELRQVWLGSFINIDRTSLNLFTLNLGTWKRGKCAKDLPILQQTLRPSETSFKEVYETPWHSFTFSKLMKLHNHSVKYLGGHPLKYYHVQPTSTTLILVWTSHKYQGGHTIKHMSIQLYTPENASASLCEPHLSVKAVTP